MYDRDPTGRISLRRAKVAQRVEAGETVAGIARDLGVTPGTIYNDIAALEHGGDVSSRRRQARAGRKVESVKDRRRFKTTPVPMGDPALLAEASATGTTFPTRVFQPSPDFPVLIDGSSNSKIGGDVLIGALKGAKIYTLTLEERATCPTSCLLWRGCYGNTMLHPRRWRHGPDLEAQLEREAHELVRRDGRVLVRLHVLGDFYSTEYVALWERLLLDLPKLHVFGFSAWPEKSEIGAAIAAMRAAYPEQWFIRTSGRTGSWGAFTVDFPTAKKQIGDAIVCPEQRDAMDGGKHGTHCGTCAFCWSCDKPLAFVEH